MEWFLIKCYCKSYSTTYCKNYWIESEKHIKARKQAKELFWEYMGFDPSIKIRTKLLLIDLTISHLRNKS